MISENYNLVIRIINLLYIWVKRILKGWLCCYIGQPLPKKQKQQHCIPDGSSMFTPEAKTVDLALDFIRTCDTNNRFIIFSDSLSVLKAMKESTGSKTFRKMSQVISEL